MLFKFYNPHGNNIIFKASSYELARKFITFAFGYIFEKDNSEIDQIGNHLTLLSTVGEGYKHLITVNENFFESD